VYRTVFALKQVGWSPELKPANRYGHNYRMTEMQAVLLRGGLRRIEEQTRIRDENAQYLAARLPRLGGPLKAARRDPRVTRQAYYAMTLVYDPKMAAGLCKHAYLWALAAERCYLGDTYWPVYRAPLLNLYDTTSPVPYRKEKLPQNYRNLNLPNTERAVNDTAVILSHGHLLGDRVLRAIGQILQANIKGRDIAARLGGEEFAVLLLGTSSQGAQVLAEQIRLAVARGRIRRIDGTELVGAITVSIGIASARAGEDFDALLARTDAALYRAKRDGRNLVRPAE
jgi:diguanylate cyclase (GGDEF)-like protein